MDSWPVNETDVEKILSGSDPLDEAYVAGLGDSERGMHTIEFLLFGEANNKTVDQFTDREKAFLQALGQDLKTQASDLFASWDSGLDGQPPYWEVFANAGAGSTVYPTVTAAGQELVTGILDSLIEVGEDKLETPFKQQDTFGLESRFSFQTINDLKSNLQSAENGYLGSFPGGPKSSTSISSYVAAIDPDLDTIIKAQFEAAQTALDAIPGTLEESLTDPDAADEIQAAIDAIIQVKETLIGQVVPLI
ncbi:MAG: peptidase M75 [Leptolyngbya sp. RL_3_1]|nr:peptidase M75 [Leptolyngbya sp. RL_3_1]